METLGELVELLGLRSITNVNLTDPMGVSSQSCGQHPVFLL